MHVYNVTIFGCLVTFNIRKPLSHRVRKKTAWVQTGYLATQAYDLISNWVTNIY